MTYGIDSEDRGTSGSRSPLLGRSSHQRIGNGKDGEGKQWSLLRVLQFFGGGIYAPDATTYDPIEILLNADDEDDMDDLTIRWRDNKLSELNFVGVVVCTVNDFGGWSRAPQQNCEKARARLNSDIRVMSVITDKFTGCPPRWSTYIDWKLA